MGLVLVTGSIFLFVFAIKKMSDKAADAADPRSAIPREYRECGNHRVSLTDKLPIGEVELRGQIARVVQRMPDGAAVITMIHLCSGERLGSVTVEPASK